MALKRLAEKCRGCPFVEKCDHKRMEGVMYLQPAAVENAQHAAMSVIREAVSVNIGGKATMVYKDEIEKALRMELSNVGMGLMYGA